MNSLNALRQVMAQQAVFTIHVKHVDLEQKSSMTLIATNSAIISKQADEDA